MNDRVQELVRQSNFHLLAPVNYLTEMVADNQKKELARVIELVVSECAIVAWFAEQYGSTDLPISKKIKQHFGVE